MRIGMTYDLRSDWLAAGYSEEQTAEFDRVDTIDAIERSLCRLGHTTDRIGRITELVRRLAAGERWDLVFNIAEGMFGIGREAQVPALLDAYEIPYTFSDPLVCAATLDKAVAKRLVRDLGLPTPPFAVIREAGQLADVDLPLPLFAKPLAEGTGKGVTAASRISSPQQLADVVGALLARFAQPVLVETFLPGREVTVGIVGTAARARPVATMEVTLLPSAEAGVYSYVNKEQCEQLVRYDLVEGPLAAEAETLALAVWRGLGCRDAGRVDLRADAAGRLQFLEVNPLAGLHPEHSDLPILAGKAGVSFDELIRWIIESAAERVAMPA